MYYVIKDDINNNRNEEEGILEIFSSCILNLKEPISVRLNKLAGLVVIFFIFTWYTLDVGFFFTLWQGNEIIGKIENFNSSLQTFNQTAEKFNQGIRLFITQNKVNEDIIGEALSDTKFAQIFKQLFNEGGILPESYWLNGAKKPNTIRKPKPEVNFGKLKNIQNFYEFLLFDVIPNKYLNDSIMGGINMLDYLQSRFTKAELQNLKGDQNAKTEPHQTTYNETYAARLSEDEKYLLYDSLLDGQNFMELSGENQATTCIQSSMDRIHSFLQSASRWSGPISMSIFVNGPVEYFKFRSYLGFVKRCHPMIYDQTRFNVATPSTNPIPRDVNLQTKDFEMVDCLIAEKEMNEKISNNFILSAEWVRSQWYPQNMMRNLARHNVMTPYRLTLDVDIVPCNGMSALLNKFLNGERVYKNALVVPTYEVSRRVDFPKNKAVLIDFAAKGLAQPFHKDVFVLNQNVTNFARWEKIHDAFDEIRVAYEINEFLLHYEPFYVEHSSSLDYNESFVGYGFTRSSHAYEMFLKNGNFLVLSPIFTVQLGLQKIKEWSPERQSQNDFNRPLFEIFISNMAQEFTNLTSKEALEFKYELGGVGISAIHRKK